MRRLLNFKPVTAGLVAATLSLGLATWSAPAEAQMRGFHGGFGGMRMGGFHPGIGRMHMGGFRGFHPGFVHRPVAFHRPFFHHRHFHRPVAFHRPFFYHRHRRFPVGAFAAGLVGGAALGTLGYGYPYYAPAAYGGECFVVRRKFVDWWGNLVIRRKLVCT